MARTARYTEQMPFVGTPDQFALMGAVEAALEDSKAAVIRGGLNVLFDLVNDRLPEGADREALVARAVEIVRNPGAFEIVRKADVAPADTPETVAVA